MSYGETGAQKAREMVAQADKKLKGFMGFGKNYEDASELLIRAANAFKLAKQWQEAGNTYQKLAACDKKLESEHDAATHYLDAGKMYLKIKNPESQNCFKKAIGTFTSMGRLSQAARALKELAEQTEKDKDIDGAIGMYSQASELYMAEDQKSEYNKCRLKLAQLYTQKDKYKEAADIFQEIGALATENNLLKFGAKDHLLNSIICKLCYDSPYKVRSSLEQFCEIDVGLQSSRQYRLADEIISAIEAGNQQAFTNAVAEYDSMTKLDSWRTSTLLKVKNRVQNADDGLEDDDFT